MNDAKKKAVSSAMVENMSVLCLFQRKKAATFKDVRTAVTIVTYVISIKCIYKNNHPIFSTFRNGYNCSFADKEFERNQVCEDLDLECGLVPPNM